jgi:hypothetical protein
MAVIKQGILGGGSGSIGGVVMTAWKGRAVIKAKPISVANPQSDGQVAQRTSFKAIAQLGALILTTYVQKICNVLSGNITGYNYYVSQNKSAYNSVGELVPANLRIGGGKIQLPASLDTVVKATSNNLDIEWTEYSGAPTVRETDVPYCIAICPSTGDVWVPTGLGTRADGNASLKLITPGSDLSGGLHVYCGMCFKAANGRDVTTETALTDFTVTF